MKRITRKTESKGVGRKSRTTTPSPDTNQTSTAAAPPLNAFAGHTEAPSGAELSAALCTARAAWDQCLHDLQTANLADRHEWHSYSVKAGWALRVLHGKRTIVWLSPLAGSFRVGFILGEKAVEAALAEPVNEALRQRIVDAKRYPEGRGVQLDLTEASQLADVVALARIKKAH